MADDDSLISVADYERAAEGLLEQSVLSYVFGGAGDEVTLRDNVGAWQRLAIHPRMLVGVGERDLGVTVTGVPRPHPLIVKGILTRNDARLAVAHGASGVAVSNHGGRQLDTVLSPADALAPIVEAVGDQIDVLVDVALAPWSSQPR